MQDFEINDAVVNHAGRGHLSEIKAYFKNDGNPKIRNEAGYSLLMAAAISRNTHLIDFLIETGIGINWQNPPYDQTPLMIACFGCPLDITQKLIDYGAALEITDITGYTALSYAAFYNRFYNAEALLRKGSNPNVQAKNGLTPLHHAVNENNLALVDLLHLSGADLNIRTEKGESPLIKAAKNGHLDIAKILLDKGADASVRDNDGNSALDLAAKANLLAMVALLTSAKPS
jgi:ankyrin repeat protein